MCLAVARTCKAIVGLLNVLRALVIHPGSNWIGWEPSKLEDAVRTSTILIQQQRQRDVVNGRSRGALAVLAAMMGSRVNDLTRETAFLETLDAAVTAVLLQREGVRTPGAG